MTVPDTRGTAQLRPRSLTVQIGLGVIALILCVACGGPRPDPTIPLPAAAQAVQRVPGIRTIVRFTIQQTPDQVIDWYKQEMVAQGWKVYIEARHPPSPGISFTSIGYRILFVLDVTVEQRANGITSVEVELKPQPPA